MENAHMFVSRCCKKPITFVDGKEDCFFYVCEKCNKPCAIIIINQPKEGEENE